MEAKDDELQTNFGATRCSIWGIELVGAGHRWAPLGTFVLILQLVAREHGLFGGHESEDIRAII